MKHSLLAILLATTSTLALQHDASAQNNAQLSSAFKPSVELHLEALEPFRKSPNNAQPIPTASQINTSTVQNLNTPIQPSRVSQPSALNQQLPASRYQQAQSRNFPRHRSVIAPIAGIDLPRGANGRILPPAPPGVKAPLRESHQAETAPQDKQTGLFGDVKSYVKGVFSDDEAVASEQAQATAPSTKQPLSPQPQPPSAPEVVTPPPAAISALPPLPPMQAESERLPSLMDAPPPPPSPPLTQTEEPPVAPAAPKQAELPASPPTILSEAPKVEPKTEPKALPVVEAQTPPPSTPAIAKPAEQSSKTLAKGNAASYDGLELAEGMHEVAPIDSFGTGNIASPMMDVQTPAPTPHAAASEPIALPKPKMPEGEQLLAHASDAAPPAKGLKDPFEDGAVSYAEATPAPLSQVPSAPIPTPSAPTLQALNEPPALANAPTTLAAPEPAPQALVAAPTPESLPAPAPQPVPMPKAQPVAEESGSWMDRLKSKVTGYFKEEEANPTPTPQIETPDLKLAEMQTPAPASTPAPAAATVGLPEGVTPKEATPPGLPSLTKLTGDPEIMQQAEAQKVIAEDMPPAAPAAPNALAADTPLAPPQAPVKEEKKPEPKKVAIKKEKPKPLQKEEPKIEEPKKVEAKAEKKEEPKETPIAEKPATQKIVAEKPAEETPVEESKKVSIAEPATEAKPEPKTEPKHVKIAEETSAAPALAPEAKGKPVELKRDDETQIASASPANVPSIAKKLDATSLSIHFDPKSKDLPESAKEQLKPIAAALKASPNARVFLKGYSSESEEPSARQYSLARMLKIRVALIQLGADELRINVNSSASSKGSEDRVDIEVKNSAGS